MFHQVSKCPKIPKTENKFTEREPSKNKNPKHPNLKTENQEGNKQN